MREGERGGESVRDRLREGEREREERRGVRMIDRLRAREGE